MADVLIRPARHEDTAAIAEIYNQGIRRRTATFETEERTAEDRARWLAAHDERHPCLVALLSVPGGERVVGWISSDQYRPRSCYRGVAEFSVYILEESQGHGVGRALLDAMITAAEQAGLWKLVARIFPENMASRALCASTGFREVGVYQKHAYLDGAWRDVIIVERLLPANVQGPPTEW